MRTIIAVCLFLAGTAWAQTALPAPATPAASPAAPSTVSLQESNADVRDVLRGLSARSGARILIGTEVTGKVTVQLTDVPLETALSVVARVTGNRWSKLTLPKEKADALTADQALALVQAAEVLAGGALSVQGDGVPAVTVGVAPAASDKAATVYLVHTKIDPALIKAARADAKQRAGEKDEAARDEAVASRMSPDARQDRDVVRAYADVQGLSPDQVATLAREYIINASPEQRQAIGDALSRQGQRIRDALEGQRNQQGQ